jgi:hypothetical protein
MSKGYPPRPPGLRPATLAVRSLTVRTSSTDVEEAGDRTPLHLRRWWRAAAWSLFLANVALVLWTIFVLNEGPFYLIPSFAASVLILVRTRWPMDTWPKWLFTWKP